MRPIHSVDVAVNRAIEGASNEGIPFAVVRGGRGFSVVPILDDLDLTLIAERDLIEIVPPRDAN